MMRKLFGRLGRTEYVRAAVEEKADLSAFHGRPKARTIFGLIVMGFSYVIGWPAIGLLGIASIHLQKPALLAVGGPAMYGLSHLVFTIGMYFAGVEYARAFLRWAARMAAERWMLPEEGEKPPSGG